MTTLIILAVVAFLAGWVDSIAGGGGLITVPALFLAGLPPHVALGTNKMQSVAGTTAASIRYSLARRTDVSILVWLVPLALLGSAAGTKAVLLVSPSLIRPLFVPVFVSIGVYMAVKRDTGAEERPEKRTSRRLWLTGALIALIGFYDGFFGPGTGVFLFLALVLGPGLDAVTATGSTKVINCATNAAALSVFLWHGSFHPTIGLTMACANALGGLTGSQMALKRGQRFIRVVVLVVVLGLSAKLAYDSYRSWASATMSRAPTTVSWSSTS